MKKFLITALMTLIVGTSSAQLPITISTKEVGDSTAFTIRWKSVNNVGHYNLTIFSNPRRFDTEMVRNVSAYVRSLTPTWNFTALRANLVDSMQIYVSIIPVSTSARVFPVTYAEITYRLPTSPLPPQPTGIIVRQDSVSLRGSR